MDFTGKTVVVTGGASGIGRATVMAFAELGADVYFGDINEAGGEETFDLVKDLNGGAAFHPLDVSDEASIAAFAKSLHDRSGKADVVANVAGWDIAEPFVDNTPDFMQKVIDINLMGTIRVTRAFLDPMIAAGTGAVVNVSSDAGRVGSSGETVYSGAKGGIIGFTKSLAREMARKGIRANVVCPGPTDTPLFATVSEKLQMALIRAIPLGRLAEPSEIADAIVFFASDRARYVTGQVLSVSGGLTMAD
ncbi:MAG: SDR family oxidoreductase [Alphaproteobacteria bacterium]|nr:SDR family oxidoreductase [Alphaproteobacteria bacterium]